MDERSKQELEEFSERDKKRLGELRAQEEAGTLSYTERIEMDLLANQEKSAWKIDDGADRTNEDAAYENLREEVLGPKVEKKGTLEDEGMDEFEIISEDEGKEPPPRPIKDLDPAKVKNAVAFGAGALMGYLLKNLLEENPDKE